MEVWEKFNSWFWSEYFWLPTNFTWKDLENKPGGIYHAQPIDLIKTPIPLALVLFCVRIIFERYIARPVGLYLGVKQKVQKSIVQNDILEEQFRKTKVPDRKIYESLQKRTDWPVRKIERWFRQRRNQGRPGALIKFQECSWRFLFYFSVFMYGICILWNKPWFWDTTYCWRGYPDQEVTSDVYWYYMVELAFYWSLLFSQFSDVQRKDFWEMFVHHIVTISLMSLSWSNNFVRIGTLVLVVHDAVDYWLEGAKMSKYCGNQKLCDILFGCFFVIWFVTRLVIFPVKVIPSAMFESVDIVGYFRSSLVFNTLLCTLQVLHVIWFILISRIAYNAIVAGEHPVLFNKAKWSRKMNEVKVKKIQMKMPLESLGLMDKPFSSNSCSIINSYIRSNL